MSSNYSQLFNSDAMSEKYHSRPQYNDEIAREIINFWLKFNADASIEKKLDIVDIGCGTGQLTKYLVPYAKSLIGLDSSESQIKEANLTLIDKGLPKYIVGSCYGIPVPNESLDLMTAAMCIHWFDIKKFYAEIDRCLKSKGVLAILAYGEGYAVEEGDHGLLEEFNKFITKEIWFEDQYFSPYFLEEGKWCWNYLPGIKYLYPDTGMRNETLNLEFKTTPAKYGDHILSSSMFWLWKKDRPDERDIVDIILEKMLFHLGNPKEGLDFELQMRYPISLIICSKP